MNIISQHATHSRSGITWNEHFIEIRTQGKRGTISFCNHPTESARYQSTYKPAGWGNGSFFSYETNDWQEAKRYALTGYAGIWEEEA
jgi:hypothetical protein